MNGRYVIFGTETLAASVQSCSLLAARLHRSNFDVVLRKLIFEL